MEPEVISACENVCRDFYWVGPLTEWLRNLAIILGVVVAAYQINTWRREHLSKRKADTALQLLSKAVSIQRAISATRSAIEHVSPNAEDSFEDLVQIKWKRLSGYGDDFDQLRELQVLHDALVGNAAVNQAVDELFDARQDIFAALDTISGWKIDDRTRKEDRDFHDKLRRTFIAMGPNHDELSPKVRDAVSTLRRELVREIRMER